MITTTTAFRAAAQQLVLCGILASGALDMNDARGDLPPPRPPDPGLPPGCEVVYAYDGAFTNEPVWMVNLLNAPEEMFKSRPPDRTIAPAVLAALNAGADGAVARAAVRYSAKACRDVWDGAAPDAKGELVRLRVTFGGSDDLGGLVGGTTLRVVLKTLGREPADAELEVGAERKVEQLASGAAALAELDRLLGEAITEANTNLARARKDEAAGVPTMVTLVVHFYSLGQDEIAAAKRLVPCLAEVAGGRVRPAASAYEKHTETVDLRLMARSADGTVRTRDALLDHVASAIRGSIGDHGKYRCSLFATPLKGRAFEVGTDRERGSVWLRFERRAP